MTYSDAPNPGLTVSGLDVIGLPLSTREAEVLKYFASQAQVAQGEQAAVDVSARTMWEIDPRLVRVPSESV